jgi:hypothetical protein
VSFTQVAISDHNLVLAIRKISVVKKQENTVEIRNMKNFDEKNFVAELLKHHGNMCIFLPKIQLPCGKFGKKYFRDPR